MSVLLGNPIAMGAGGSTGKLEFTYTGDYTEREDGVVELRSSGTITFPKEQEIDIFCVGGGGGGNVNAYYSTSSSVPGGGGGGGRTTTVKNVSIRGSVNVTIGAGGSAGVPGGTTSFGTFAQADGGASAPRSTFGNSGGSGGGGGTSLATTGGAGGTDGGAGAQGGNNGGRGGSGQGGTTREFGEAEGKLYAGGGGGARLVASSAPVVSMGGDGGGGNGAWASYNHPEKYRQNPTDGVANTGSGGGGGLYTVSADISGTNVTINGASGGSGIVCIRLAAPLPELAGTWVLNERLYAPEFGPSAPGKQTSQAVTFTAGSDTFTSFVFYWPSVNDNNMYYQNSAKTTVIYNFISNTYYSGVIKTITFPAGATASDEFRAWLASNATKQ